MYTLIESTNEPGCKEKDEHWNFGPGFKLTFVSQVHPAIQEWLRVCIGNCKDSMGVEIQTRLGTTLRQQDFEESWFQVRDPNLNPDTSMKIGSL